MNIKVSPLQDNISFIVNSKGKATSMVINLKNKKIREWAEKLKEDLIDLEIVKNCMEEDPTREGSVDFFSFSNSILAKRAI